MATTSFEELVTNMVNVSLGAAAMAADKGKEFVDELSARGVQARDEAAQSDLGRSVTDAFKQAGDVANDAAERLASQGATVAERVLDELIVARVRPLTTPERAAFVTHVTELVDAVPTAAVNVPVETVEPDEDAPADAAPADAATTDDEQ